MAHIVILGAGIGGAPAAYELRQTLDKSHQITVVSDRPYFQFVPSNPWAAVGWREREQITFDIGKAFAKKDIRFIASACQGIMPQDNSIHLANGEQLSYDYLIIATGPRLAFDLVEGSDPKDGQVQSVCSVDHAELAKEAYDRLLDKPGPVVIGAMPGASCFGPAYEFSLIVNRDLRKRKLRHKIPMTYVTSEPYIGHLGLGGVGNSKTILENELRDNDINWITNAQVTKVENNTLFIDQLDNDGNLYKQHRLPFDFSMMLPAFRGIPAVANVPELCNPGGFVLVDEHQRSPKYNNIFATGVCIAIAPVEQTPVATGAPKTGYMIESMTSAIVKNIDAELKGEKANSKGTWSAFCLADMGNTGAAFLAVPQLPPRNINWYKKGRWVHWAKVAFEKFFIYKMKKGKSEMLIERYTLKALGVERIRKD